MTTYIQTHKAKQRHTIVTCCKHVNDRKVKRKIRKAKQRIDIKYSSKHN